MGIFNQNLLFNMLESASKNIHEQVPMLNQLDGKTGDGDHGTTMERVCNCIDESLVHDLSDWHKQIDDLGWTIMSQDGGSAGMLVGNLFIGLADGLLEKELSPVQTAVAFRCGLDRLIKFSGAKQGDKTMLDALIPAIEALEKQAVEAESIDEMFRSAALAASNGAQATIAMKPVRGRAKNMGEKAVGFVDPGATSMKILFESFNQSINEKNSENNHG
jgi:dihydroxyacetone kinase-like protein